MIIQRNIASAILAHLCLTVAAAENTALRMGAGSYLGNGHLAYVFAEQGVRTLHLMKITGGEPQRLFSKQIDMSSGAPILVAGAVVLVDTAGKMLKLDYSGKVLFDGALPNFTGASKFSGRLDSSRIYVENTFGGKNQDGIGHQVWIVDVSKDEPVVLQKHSTGQFVKTFVSYPDTLYLFGLDGVEKVKF